MRGLNMRYPESALKSRKTMAIFVMVLLLQFATITPLTAQTEGDMSETSEKSPVAASIIALSSTTFPVLSGFMADPPASLILLSGGLVLGPVLGYTYMDETRLGFRYATRRAIVFGGTIGAVSLICAVGDCSLGLFGDESGSEFDLAVTLAAVGTLATVFLNLEDTFSIGRRVDSERTQLAVTPTYFPRENTPGLRAVWRF